MENLIESTVVLVATPFYCFAIVFELVCSNIARKKVYSFRGAVENVYLTLLNMAVDVLLRGAVLALLTFCYTSHLIDWSNAVVYWVALLIAEDFMFYWLHRVDHHVRLFWAVHVTHHSSEEFNLTVGFRSSVFQPVYRFLYFIPLVFLGFKPIDILLMYSLTQTYGIIIHTQLVNKLGFLEYILVTPSHHRVHHASNVQYLDRNLGMIFIFWDKLFGTFTPEEETPRYGLTKNVSHEWFHIVFHEWKSIFSDIRRATSWKARFMYIFGPPGWSHDGSSLTSQQMLAQHRVRLPR